VTANRATVRLAVAQFAMADDADRNLARAAELVRAAAAGGARLILLPELFEHPYFPKEEDRAWFGLARSAGESRALGFMSDLSRELAVVIPVSFFEKVGDRYYNSVAVIDADGRNAGIYRKSHVPDGAGYQEKFYFSPGDTGFRVFDTRHARLGIGICWDQWFPESARALTLLGAELLLFPSAIGSEPDDPGLDTREPWRRAMVGQAVSNAIPLSASNRVGDEKGLGFYGSSFIVDHMGEVLAAMDREQEGFTSADLDLGEASRYRERFGLLSDRRPDLYGPITAATARER
jgi:N-carbamoylputrescine amidase